MRLGAPIFAKGLGPQEWAAAVRAKRYRAAYCPVDARADDHTVAAYVRAAHEADIIIAEVGAWCNPISPDETIRQKAICYCQERLALADRVGARCCVNIAGSRSSDWAGPDADNLSPDTFDLIVETVRLIIDAVKPTRTFYTLEAMPWTPPDSTESYVVLLEAIGRRRMAVHFDPANLLNSPRTYYGNSAIVRDFVARLGPHIRSCHAKDILISGPLSVHLDEVRPGTGNLDYRALLGALSTLDPDMPVMLEHLPNESEYDLAAQYVRGVAAQLNIAV
jgi:sugar phosphate isomerase/epimerase